jgi:DnaJ-class molecular chaperone
MNLLTQLFSKTPSARDVRMQLKEIERDQLRKRRDLEVLEQTKQEKVKLAVSAKKAGKQDALREVFREMRQIEIDHGYTTNDLRRLSLSKTALTSFLRKIELLERKKDRKSLQNMIARFQKSSLQKAIDVAEVDDDTFHDMLEEILGEEEVTVTQGKEKEDAGFAEFDRAITEMAKAEEAGDSLRLPDTIERPEAKGPDNYPSYGDKPAAKAPDNYPSYGDKPQGREPLKNEFVKLDTCSACQGAGGYYEACVCSNGIVPTNCGTCSGNGSIRCPVCGGVGSRTMPCPICNGGGCQSCGGKGTLTQDCGMCRTAGVIACGYCRGTGTINATCSRCNGQGKIWKTCGNCGGVGQHVAGRAPSTKGPDNYPSYGDKPKSVKGLSRETATPVFAAEGDAEAEADPCAADCVGGTATRQKVHG